MMNGEAEQDDKIGRSTSIDGPETPHRTPVRVTSDNEDSSDSEAEIDLGDYEKRRETNLRRLLVLGATAVIRHSRSKSTAEAGWLKSLLERRPARLVSVAQANKTARIVWALLVRGEAYRMPAAVA